MKEQASASLLVQAIRKSVPMSSRLMMSVCQYVRNSSFLSFRVFVSSFVPQFVKFLSVLNILLQKQFTSRYALFILSPLFQLSARFAALFNVVFYSAISLVIG